MTGYRYQGDYFGVINIGIYGEDIFTVNINILEVAVVNVDNAYSYVLTNKKIHFVAGPYFFE